MDVSKRVSRPVEIKDCCSSLDGPVRGARVSRVLGGDFGDEIRAKELGNVSSGDEVRLHPRKEISLE